MEEVIAKAMNPFSEDPLVANTTDADADKYSFWDWYRIGGRFSGEHFLSTLDPEKLEAFSKELQEKKITVSSVQCGKQTLLPTNQSVLVNELWKKYGFPSRCPFFDDVERNSYDICKMSEVSVEKFIASRFAVVDADKDLFSYMLAKSLYNGVTWQDSVWDGKIQSALDLYKEHYIGKKYPVTPGSWIVTVDYHS